MFKNVSYNQYKSTIHLWEQFNGEDHYTDIPWVPYLFEPVDDGPIKTIDGKRARKIVFDSYNLYDAYQKTHKEVLENNLKPEIQFLAERYYKIEDDKIDAPRLKIYYLDIEVYSKTLLGFPVAEHAAQPIVLISVYDGKHKKVVSFGDKPYTGNIPIEFNACASEKELLESFFAWFKRNPCDVISGWNVINFDMQYIVNRCKRLFGDDTRLFCNFSPIKSVRVWTSNTKEFNIDISGCTILDYYDLYKWYSPTKLERYKLDFVARHELGEGKVDYATDYKDLKGLYENNWNLYVEYNAKDTSLIDQLETKLGYVGLVQALSLLCKSPMRNYHATAQLIEGIYITYYRRNNMCAPHFFENTHTGFPAAVVKEPVPGLYSWITDLDITSSYPSHIITLNMSIETYYGRIKEMTDDEVTSHVRKGFFPPIKISTSNGIIDLKDKRLETFNKALEKRFITIAPCGTIFTTNVPGIIAIVENYLFNKRAEIRDNIRKMYKALPELRNGDLDNIKTKIKQFDALQISLKLVLNATYGILSAPHSRYFNQDIAEAITSCGRYTVLQGEKFVNKLLNSPNDELINMISSWGTYNHDKKTNDFVIYLDTDSLFLNLGLFLDCNIGTDWRKNNDEDIKTLIRNISSVIQHYVNEHIYRDVQRKSYNSNEEKFRIVFKQEMIAKTGLMVKKKRYGFYLVEEDKAPKDKVYTKGLETVRSDTPEIIRPMLKDIMNMILKVSTDEELMDKIDKCKDILKKCTPNELAVNIGVHQIGEYLDEDDEAKKGTPWHVKGIANYRKLLEIMGLTDKYEDVIDETKVKVVYVKKNPFLVDMISFLDWPKEFDEILQVDYEKMIEKYFIAKVEILVNPMNKKYLLSSSVNKALSLFF